MTPTTRKRSKRPLREMPGRLSVSWGTTRDQGRDLYFTWGPGCASADGHLLHYFFEYAKDPCTNRSLREELMARGYDIQTLRFTIMKVQPQERSPK
jgi:hypothetical protein